MKAILALKAVVPGFGDVKLRNFGMTIGVRDSRKIVGEYHLTDTDVTTEAKFDTTELHLRFPFLENESGRSLEGETKIDLLYDFNADTFRYEISIKDRAFHLSNVITTSELITN